MTDNLTYLTSDKVRKLRDLPAHDQSILDRIKAHVADLEGLLTYAIEKDDKGSHLRGVRISPNPLLEYVYDRKPSGTKRVDHNDSPFMHIDLLGKDFGGMLSSMKYSPLPNDAKPFFRSQGGDFAQYNESAKPEDKLIDSVPLARAGQYLRAPLELELLRRATGYFPINMHGALVCNIYQSENGPKIHSIDISPNMAGERLKDALLSKLSDRVRFHGHAIGLNRTEVENLDAIGAALKP